VSVVEAEGGDEVVACTLGPADARAQLDEWANLRELFRQAEPTSGGVRLWFDSVAEMALRTVAAKEAACCGFLRFGIVGEGDLVRLEITSESADAQPVIALLAALAAGPGLE
jgi:hypothetical protein